MKVSIVDYGIGNLHSVRRAFEVVGAEVAIVRDALTVGAAERLVLPGVGAFEDGMTGLRERGLADSIRRHVASGKAMLGICLGMQMLATVSEEFGTHEGLDLIPGRVVPIPRMDQQGRPHKIPHIGWTALRRPPGVSWDRTPLADTPEYTSVYLVHSYAVVPDDDRDCLADCVYGGHVICAAVRRGRLFGCQFHPEKSGPAGLAMVARFLGC
jgi:glutamine amidotransferase